MKRYLLNIMKGQDTSFIALVIMYLLVPWSMLYRLGVFFHRIYFRLKGTYHAPKPVISIGNLTVGGSGKTPLVVWLARKLQDKGFKSIILIRGYMPKKSKHSDEVDMLNEQIPFIPVLAGSDRIKSIKEVEGNLPVDVYICDDAFQHWPLYRDLNIVTIDAANPFGNGYLLPAGILREGKSALKRADVFILTKTQGGSNTDNLVSLLKKINPRALIMESRYKSACCVELFDGVVFDENFLKEKRIAGFCAIGDPVSFQSSLKNSGAELLKTFVYMDHHLYRKKDIEVMVAFCRAQGITVMVTTHKDAVKLRKFKDFFSGIQLTYIPIQLEVTKGADEFFEKIISICTR